jgi:hypothetical protein
MNSEPEFELVKPSELNALTRDPGGSPFRVVIDPSLRLQLRKALVELINDHEETLAEYVANGQLSLDSNKEYIELFARGLRETMGDVEGVGYLMKAAGFEIPNADINLNPDWRWKSTTPE